MISGSYEEGIIVYNTQNIDRIEKNFNDLTNTPCSLEDYHFAMNVYKSFNCKNLYE